MYYRKLKIVLASVCFLISSKKEEKYFRSSLYLAFICNDLFLKTKSYISPEHAVPIAKPWTTANVSIKHIRTGPDSKHSAEKENKHL